MKFKSSARALFHLAGDNCKFSSGTEFFSWSAAAIDAIAGIFCGDSFEQLELSRVSDKAEAVHLVYFYYLRRLADPGAIERFCARDREGLVESCRTAILRSEEYAQNGRIDYSLEAGSCSGRRPRIYFDVSNTKNTKARTGIQRVVRELARELSVDELKEVVYIAYIRAESAFKRVKLIDDEFVELDSAEPVQFARGDIYFDGDGSWGDAVPRWSLYQQLRQVGVRILNVHYDAAPILFPMFSHPITVLRFLEHFFALCNFSDKLLCISNAVQQDYIDISTHLNIRVAPTTVMPLGNVFSVLQASLDVVPSDVISFSKERFALFVGTVEPRKNYSLLLKNIIHFQRLGLKIILVGKRGWERDDVIEQLEAAQSAGELLWLKNASDSVLRYLYETCYLYVSVAHYEGYGLPVLEALSYGCAVVTSDGGALAEVGKGHTLNFQLSDESGLANVLDSLCSEPGRYKDLKEKSSNFRAPIWSETAEKIWDVMNTYLVGVQTDFNWQKLQLIYISIRPDSLLRSLTSFKKFGHAGAVVVLTSTAMKTQVESVLISLGVQGSVLCDEDLFGSETIPIDHQERNFQLRKRFYASTLIESVFLSLDDDAILLKPLRATHYNEQGKYNAYYYYGSMSNWKASPFGITSYDKGQWRTSRLLLEHFYDDMSFSAHQPQIIDKTLVQEVYSEFSSCVDGGVDEWSLYFNVCMSRYSNLFTAKPVTTLNWPEDFSSWVPGWFIDEINYMNYSPAKISVDEYSQALFGYAADYDKYHAQRLLGGCIKPLRLCAADDNVLIGLPDIWVDIETVETISGVGYRIYRDNHVVVDGGRDIQAISPCAPLKVKMPRMAGEYHLRVFVVDQNVEITTATVLVFPWRANLSSVEPAVG